MIVKITPGGDRVSANLRITGPVHWAYLLSSPDHTYKKAGTSNAVNPMDLGVPADLQLDPHEWTVHLANMTAADVRYDVVLDFVQAGKPVATWSKNGTLKSGDEAVLDDKTIVVIDPALAVGARS